MVQTAEIQNDQSVRMFRLVILIVALLPVVFGLITQNYRNDIQPGWQIYTRWYSLPVMAAELLCIVLALVGGSTLREGIVALARPLQIALLLVVAIALGTMAFVATNMEPARIRTTAWIIHLLFGMSLAGLAARAMASFGIEKVWRWIGFGLLAYFIALIGFLVLMPDPKNFEWGAFNFGVLNIRQLGFFSGTGYGLMLGLAITTQNKKVHIAAAIMATAMLWISFWTGTRSSILGCVLALGAGWLFISAMRSWRAIAISAATMVAALGLAFIHPAPDPFYRAERLFWSMTEANNSANDESNLTSGRAAMWKATIAAIGDRPVFGNGESQFSTRIPKTSLGYNHPHNAFLQIAYQWGIAGALAFFFLFFAALWKIIRISRENPLLGLPAFLSITSMFGMAMTEGALYHTWPVMMMAFAAAIAIGGSKALPKIHHKAEH